MTAASRRSKTLNEDQRRDLGNGIWLCQNDAKLVDNDAGRYTLEALRRWKAQAEETAQRELERCLSRQPDMAAIFTRMERLMPDLLAEMRQDLATQPLRREFVVKKRAWAYNGGGVFFYFYDDHVDLDDKLRILQSSGLIEDITRTNAKRYAMSEQLAEYLGAP